MGRPGEKRGGNGQHGSFEKKMWASDGDICLSGLVLPATWRNSIRIFPPEKSQLPLSSRRGTIQTFFPSSPQRGRDELLCCSTPAAAVRNRKERYRGKVCPTLQKFFIFLPPVPGGTRDYIKFKSAKEEEEELTAPLGPCMRRLHFHSRSPCIIFAIPRPCLHSPGEGNLL